MDQFRSTDIGDCLVNLFKDLLLDWFGKVDTGDLCGKARGEAFDLDVMIFGIGGVRHDERRRCPYRVCLNAQRGPEVLL